MGTCFDLPGHPNENFLVKYETMISRFSWSIQQRMHSRIILNKSIKNRRTLEYSRCSTVFVVTHESMYMSSIVRGRIGGALSNTRTDDSKGPIGTKQSLIELTDGVTDEDDDAWRRALDDARGTTNVKPEALQAVRARWRWTRRGEI